MSDQTLEELRAELTKERARREEAERMLNSIAAKPDGERVSLVREYYEALLADSETLSDLQAPMEPPAQQPPTPPVKKK